VSWGLSTEGGSAYQGNDVRLILGVLSGAGALALAIVLAAWMAERRMAAEAERWSSADVARAPVVEMAVVLGAAPIGPEGGPNRYLVYRLDAAAALWKAGKVKALIVSGTRTGEAYDEPAAMEAGLVARGVPAGAILRDNEGFRTRDSVLRARDFFHQSKLIIVSQRFHVGRALYIAHRAGIEAWGLDARDVDAPYSVFTELRRFPSALIGMAEAWASAR
jgi:SanA protein